MSPERQCPGSPHSPQPGSPRTITDLLTCPVCLEGYRDPKTLVCLHTFCSVCLENCRRPYRREIICPVCKKCTPLSPHGVNGLQNDFRIQQIRDILQSGQPSPPLSDDEGACASPDKPCDLCKIQQARTQASHHCVQCCIFFCHGCVEKHASNPLFVEHHVINMHDDNAAETLFCKVHKEYSIRYFCKPCGMMLCTICTMGHDQQHSPVSLDKNVISTYQKDLKGNLKSIKSKLNEVKSRTKYLETVRQTYQKALYEAQNSIKDKTNELIDNIREQERQLLQEAMMRMETKMRQLGLDNLGEMNFHKTNIENLHQDVVNVMQGSPQQCLVAYEDLINRMKAVSESTLPILLAPKVKSVVKFIPAEDGMSVVLGQLQEIGIQDELPQDGVSTHQPYISYNDVTMAVATPRKGVPKRVTSILNALSPVRKGDVKIGKVKAFSTHGEKAKKAINADDLISSACSESDEPQPSTSSLQLDTPPGSPPQGDTNNQQYLTKPKLVFKVDQVGGWPGKIMNPSSVDFLLDGSVVVAEGDNRLQVFDRNGQSLRIIGWGKIKPQGITVTRDGKIAITDKKDKCVKIFTQEGELRSQWGSGMFGLPAGIATLSSGNFVVTDVDRHAISIHSPDGSLLTQFGTWGSGDYQFNSPAYVAINHSEEILISDSCNGCVKVFDQHGKFIRKFTFTTNAQGSLRRPQGICIDKNGKILVADRDNHRVALFNPDGMFVRYILSRTDSIKYPCDIKLNEEGHVVIVETHSGFLSKEPHHAIKMFKVLG